MRQVAAFFGALVIFTACGSAIGATDNHEGLLVVATMSVLADLAANVGGDSVEVVSIVPLGGDPHAYEPTPSDAAKIAEADLVVDNGLGLSPWFRPLSAHARGTIAVLTEHLAGDAIDAHDGVVDPHMWLAPPLASAYVDVIADALVEVDPANAEHYRENAAAYRAEIELLDAGLRSRLEAIPPERRKLVTYEDAFNYFAAHYDFDVVASVVGPTTEEEPSAAQIRRLIDRTVEEEVPVMFVETTVDDRVLLRAAIDAGVRLEGPLHVDSVGEAGSGAETYVGMMRRNVETLVEGLRGGG